MSAVRWEYASVLWTSKLRRISRADPEYARLGVETHRQWLENDWAYGWWAESSYSIWLPDSTEEDVRHAWVTGEPEARVRFVDLLNELGADGWEVISHTVRSSAVGPYLGRQEAGFPTQTTTLLKRPVVATLQADA